MIIKLLVLSFSWLVSYIYVKEEQHDIYFRCIYVYWYNPMLIQVLVDFPSSKRRVCAVQINTGRGSHKPNLIAFVKPHCDGSTALLVGWLTMYLMVDAAIFQQSGLPIIARVEGKAPSEDIQTFGWGSEAVVAAVETTSVVGFHIVKLYYGPRTVGFGCRQNCHKCYCIFMGTFSKKIIFVVQLYM